MIKRVHYGPSKKNWGKWPWPVSAIALVALGLSFIFGPDSLPGLDICLFHAVTGLQCPGCGITRAFCAISHGQFAHAWGLNPFAYPFYALAVVALVFPPIFWRVPEKWAIASLLVLAAALIVFGVFRVVAGFGLGKANRAGAHRSHPSTHPPFFCRNPHHLRYH